MSFYCTMHRWFSCVLWYNFHRADQFVCLHGGKPQYNAKNKTNWKKKERGNRTEFRFLCIIGAIILRMAHNDRHSTGIQTMACFSFCLLFMQPQYSRRFFFFLGIVMGWTQKKKKKIACKNVDKRYFDDGLKLVNDQRTHVWQCQRKECSCSNHHIRVVEFCHLFPRLIVNGCSHLNLHFYFFHLSLLLLFCFLCPSVFFFFFSNVLELLNCWRTKKKKMKIVCKCCWFFSLFSVTLTAYTSRIITEASVFFLRYSHLKYFFFCTFLCKWP